MLLSTASRLSIVAALFCASLALGSSVQPASPRGAPAPATLETAFADLKLAATFIKELSRNPARLTAPPPQGAEVQAGNGQQPTYLQWISDKLSAHEDAHWQELQAHARKQEFFYAHQRLASLLIQRDADAAGIAGAEAQPFAKHAQDMAKAMVPFLELHQLVTVRNKPASLSAVARHLDRVLLHFRNLCRAGPVDPDVVKTVFASTKALRMAPYGDKLPNLGEHLALVPNTISSAFKADAAELPTKLEQTKQQLCGDGGPVQKMNAAWEAFKAAHPELVLKPKQSGSSRKSKPASGQSAGKQPRSSRKSKQPEAQPPQQ